MIPVALADEPPSFDSKVRQPGLAAIAGMVGEPVSRRGRKRKKHFAQVQDIPPEEFPPYWRKVLPEMREAYEGRCAYLAMYIEPGTGASTVDHVLPKSYASDQIYQWTNYRLCAARINAMKGALLALVDPFAIGQGWFALNLNTFEVERGDAAPVAEWCRIDATLPVLNQKLCIEQRAEYARCFWLGSAAGGFDLAHLEERAPFLAKELQRQGWLLQVRCNWFALNLDSLHIERGPAAPAEWLAQIEGVLPAINHSRVLKVRQKLVHQFELGELALRVPFIASELLRRQQDGGA